MNDADSLIEHQVAQPRALASAQVLNIWEERRSQTMTRRALALLDASLPKDDAASMADLPIGMRDRLLLRLRAACFGETFECLCTCPDCGETVEFTLAVSDLVATMGNAPRGHGHLDLDGRQIGLRPVTSRDLLALEGRGSEEIVLRLIERCIDGVENRASDLSTSEAGRLSEALAELDPGADLKLSLTCPDCGAAWNSPFDIASYLWTEVEMAARRLLPEVHALASSYGWSEKEILALSPARRRSYIALLGAH